MEGFFRGVLNVIKAKIWTNTAKDGTGIDVQPLADSDGHLQVDVQSITTGDIQIGAVEIKNSTDDTRATVSTKGLHVFDTVANSLVPSTYDYISLSYTDDDLTGVVYKTGGASGTTVSTLTLAYTDGNLISVTKS